MKLKQIAYSFLKDYFLSPWKNKIITIFKNISRYKKHFIKDILILREQNNAKRYWKVFHLKKVNESKWWSAKTLSKYLITFPWIKFQTSTHSSCKDVNQYCFWLNMNYFKMTYAFFSKATKLKIISKKYFFNQNGHDKNISRLQ